VDVETAMALERVRDRIDGLEVSVRGDIAGLVGSMAGLGGSVSDLRGSAVRLEGSVADLRASVAEIRGSVAEVRGSVSELRDMIVEQGNALRIEFRQEIADARRHAVLLNEGTRDDIRLVAEAVALLTVKVESLQR
jgi:hypothetical protein